MHQFGLNSTPPTPPASPLPPLAIPLPFPKSPLTVAGQVALKAAVAATASCSLNQRHCCHPPAACLQPPRLSCTLAVQQLPPALHCMHKIHTRDKNILNQRQCCHPPAPACLQPPRLSCTLQIWRAFYTAAAAAVLPSHALNTQKRQNHPKAAPLSGTSGLPAASSPVMHPPYNRAEHQHTTASTTAHLNSLSKQHWLPPAASVPVASLPAMHSVKCRAKLDPRKLCESYI